jgi:hypothetical protein
VALAIVSATASPLFGDFLILVSVTDNNGVPVSSLKPGAFKVALLASLNHAFPQDRPVQEAKEGPSGFYTLTLVPNNAQPTLPKGHYVLAVAVSFKRNTTEYQGQTVAVGDMVA